MSTKIEVVPCKVCRTGSSMMMLTDTGKLTAVWCQCGQVQKNKVLEYLRRECGWNLNSSLFSRKVKPAFNRKLILGKFRTEAELTKALDHITAKLGLSKADVDERVKVVGPEKAYRALEVSLSRLG